ncbi:hypothetical protein HDU93_002437 [Gonapodya sp. JEL0774]|nr:hypothetical protein HDU93_002437 [Gonapodya sp. JEL0774]
MPAGQVVLIVGASTGIGKALADFLISLGYKVMVSGRSTDKLAAQKELLGTKYPYAKENFEYTSADVLSKDDMRNLWDKTWHLILNAWSSANPNPAKASWWEMVDEDLDYWETDINTGLIGQMRIMNYGECGRTDEILHSVVTPTKLYRTALTHWRRHHHPGSIIWTGSGVGFPGVVRPHYVYATVKMAMMRMADVFDGSVRSKAYKGPRIRMNVVAPGTVYIEKRASTIEEATKLMGEEKLKAGGGWVPMPVLLNA